MATPVCCCVIWSVHESTVGIVTRLGAFKSILNPGGPYIINPFFDSMQYVVNLRQLQVPVIVRTKVDKAEVTLTVKVQYKVVNTDAGIRLSQFTLSNPVQQIQAYVQDVLRSAVSDLTVEQVFDSKDEIGREVFNDLHEKMKGFGYEILQTLVTDVEPSGPVKQSFDLNNLNKYLKEADKFRQMIITSEKNTLSDAAKRRDEILGQGISLQRQEIVNGLKGSVDEFTDKVAGVSPRDVLELVLVTQYFDMLKDIGEAGKANVIFTPGGEGSAAQLRDSILQGRAAFK